MQALTSSGAVVVGFDRSERSRRAVRWAAAEAASQHRPLLLVHVLNWPADHHPKALLPGEETLLGPLQRMLQRELDELTADCRSEVDLEVRSALPLGDPAEVLGRLALDAAELVLGGPLLGRESGVLGSTAADLLARRGGAPLVVVRQKADRRISGSAPVVVGIDGSQASPPVIGFAFDFASRHRCPVRAVHTWSDLPRALLDRMRNWELSGDELMNDARAVLDSSLAGWVQRYPDVEVHCVVTPEKPAQTLLEASGDARLLVVGSHGRGRVHRTFLGSVSHAAVTRAPCPVAVVRTS
ncbi:MAG: universal stress protein [Saccharopolyspora rectivirgula]